MAIAVLGTGDVLMVTQPDRLARSTRDLLNTLAAITDRKKAGFRSLGDAWAALTNSPRTSGERPPRRRNRGNEPAQHGLDLGPLAPYRSDGSAAAADHPARGGRFGAVGANHRGRTVGSVARVALGGIAQYIS